MARRQAPEADEAPGDFPAQEVLFHVAFGRSGISRHADLLPGGAPVPGAVQLGTEVAVVQGRVPGAIPGIRQGERDVVPQEGHGLQFPGRPSPGRRAVKSPLRVDSNNRSDISTSGKGLHDVDLAGF